MDYRFFSAALKQGQTDAFRHKAELVRIPNQHRLLLLKEACAAQNLPVVDLLYHKTSVNVEQLQLMLAEVITECPQRDTRVLDYLYKLAKQFDISKDYRRMLEKQNEVVLDWVKDRFTFSQQQIYLMTAHCASKNLITPLYWLMKNHKEDKLHIPLDAYHYALHKSFESGFKTTAWSISTHLIINFRHEFMALQSRFEMRHYPLQEYSSVIIEHTEAFQSFFKEASTDAFSHFLEKELSSKDPVSRKKQKI